MSEATPSKQMTTANPSSNQSVNRSHPGHYLSTVVENRFLSQRYYLLVLSKPPGMENPKPGSFVHVMVPDGRFFLRRPFSVLDYDERTLSLFVVEKGTGTQIMRTLKKGATIDLIGPLGSAFPSMPGRRVLALGGGVGLAPLYLYGTKRSADDCDEFHLLYGARNKEDLFVDSFDWAHEGIELASDDGSHGFKGNVVEFAAREIERSPVDVIFSCGPTPMLRAADEFARKQNLPHYVSLENRMACALGACRSCVVLTGSGDAVRYQTVCHDGPVFDADALVWDSLPEP